MAKPPIFLTRTLHEKIMNELSERFDLRYERSDRSLEKDAIKKGLRDSEGLISMLSDPIDREVIEAGNRLKIIANYAVGYNNIDLLAAKERSIAVTNTPGVLTETTADLSWALLTAVARRIPEADRWVRDGKWQGWAPTELLGHDIHNKTLGIIGMGRIGQAVARRAGGFSMRVIYTSRTRRSDIETSLGIHCVSLDELLRTSDFVSLHLPLTDASTHLIDRRAFQKMKTGAFLINTARGPIVDENALVDALMDGDIAGAGLDVYENEPEITQKLLRMDNVVALPHIGSASHETRVAMGKRVLENLIALFSNRRPPNMVN
ncbi:MAG: 2-hydroxyacid dehydrogenase [Nitrospiria bacterium]